MITKRRTSFTQTEKTILMTTEPTIDCFKHKGPRKSNVCKSSMACSSWDMNSLREVLPESPSPICSTASTSPLSSPTCSHKADTFFTQLPIESSPTPRNQSFFTASNGVKNSRVEVNEYDSMEHAKHFGHFYHPNMQKQNNCPKVLEEYSGQASTQSLHEASNEGSPDAIRHSLMTRPKPYSTFLDEVNKQELQAEIEAWRKAKQMEIMDRLKRKESVISKWELKHISKAMEEMKKFERKLEKKRAKALEKLEKRISTTKAEADQKTAKARQETIKKIAAISKVSSKTLATKNSSWIKLIRLS